AHGLTGTHGMAAALPLFAAKAGHKLAGRADFGRRRDHEQRRSRGWGMLGWARRAWICLFVAAGVLGFVRCGPATAMEPADEGRAPRAAPVARWPRADGAPRPRRLQDTRVTVLLWMAPGSYGIRRGHPTADPILCLPDGCYVSRGPELAARFFPGRRALGVANTWGGRAGACRNELACVFRDIDLGRLPGYLQPVDLHILKHDRRRGQQIVTDSSCRLERGRLICDDGIVLADYGLWIVPESLAAAAGPDVLWRALTEGL